MIETRQVYVVKIGGNIVDDAAALTQFLEQLAAMDGSCILVHGGGKLATRLAQALGIQQQMVDGRRITDAETLQVVAMVYAGSINKDIVAKLQAMQVQALGICGADGNLIRAHKRRSNSSIGKAGIDYGFVGDVDAVNTTLLLQLLQMGITPVIAPITHDGQGQLLNTNADTIAAELAKALSDHYRVRLMYCFEKPGILLNAEDDNSVINTLTKARYLELKAQGVFFDGILPKIDNAFQSLALGVQEVVIGHAHQLLENAGERTVGTLITQEP